MKVLVVGGTGTVGSQVTRELLQRGHTVRVLTRSAEKARGVPIGAEGVVGDLEKPATLPAVFQGQEAVFIATPLGQTETQEGLAAVDAARTAGAGRIVHMSVHQLESAPHIPHFASKQPIEQAIRASGLAFTILAPNNFFQNDLWDRETIAKLGIYTQPIGNVGLNRVDVRDIAEAALNALTGSGHGGKTYPLVGPEVLTGDSVAEIYSRHLGRSVRYAGDDLDAWAEQARKMLPGWMVHDLRIMYKHFQEHGLLATEADFAEQQKILGHSPRSFEAFAGEIAHSWKV